MSQSMRKSKVAMILLAAICLMSWTIMSAIAMADDAAKTGATTADHKMAAHSDKPKMSGPLDGKHFAGMVGLDGKTDGNKEEISFKNGMFMSSYCMSQGFKAAPYTATTADGVTTFHSEQTDPAKGKLVWDGTIGKDGAFMATGSVTAEGKDAMKYWIKGSPQVAHASHSTGTKKK